VEIRNLAEGQIMGGLIKTKGTKLLAGHFNDEFSTYIAWYRNKQVAPPGVAPAYTLFDATGWPGNNVDVLKITDYLTDTDVRHSRRSDHRTLLPDSEGHPSHTNLDMRWRWFLNLNNVPGSPYALTQANHNLIAEDIFIALNDLSYNSISFDVVEDPTGQTVVVSTHSDSVNGAAFKSMQILLKVTGPIPIGPLPAVAPATPLQPLDGPPY
jgi:hypothetical protein